MLNHAAGRQSAAKAIAWALGARDVATNHYAVMKVAGTKNDCKKDGWQHVVDSNFGSFKNQGDCVSFVATQGRSGASG